MRCWKPQRFIGMIVHAVMEKVLSPRKSKRLPLSCLRSFQVNGCKMLMFDSLAGWWIMTENTAWSDWEMIPFTPEERKEFFMKRMEHWEPDADIHWKSKRQQMGFIREGEVWKAETCHFFILSINSIFYKLLYITLWGCHSCAIGPQS